MGQLMNLALVDVLNVDSLEFSHVDVLSVVNTRFWGVLRGLPHNNLVGTQFVAISASHYLFPSSYVQAIYISTTSIYD